jgi:hypothetical protein
MDNATRTLLKEILPNVPDTLAEEWLAPYVAMEGPPQSHGRWLNIFAGKPLDFWRNVSWELECVNLVSILQASLTPDSNRALTEMESGYFEGVSNPYSQQIQDGKERTLRALSFLQLHHVFPCPPVLLRHPDESIEIVDGNHRVLAFVQAMKAYPPTANAVQKAWVGKFIGLPQSK